MEVQVLLDTIFMWMEIQLLLQPTLKELDLFIVRIVEVHIVLLILLLIDKVRDYNQILLSSKQLQSLQNLLNHLLCINLLESTRFNGQLQQAQEELVSL